MKVFPLNTTWGCHCKSLAKQIFLCLRYTYVSSPLHSIYINLIVICMTHVHLPLLIIIFVIHIICEFKICSNTLSGFYLLYSHSPHMLVLCCSDNCTFCECSIRVFSSTSDSDSDYFTE